MSSNSTTTTAALAMAASANPFPVKPAGYLIGSYLALAMYGIHLAQVHRYFSTYKKDQLRTRLLVCWVVGLSSAQILIIVASGYHYLVGGLSDASVWGEFWWPLSFQDGLIPLMAFTAQLYFGRRAWIMIGRKRWFAIAVAIVTTITLAAGFALAITARIWANDPWVSYLQIDSRAISTPSQVVAITWMGLSAATDGALTLVLLWKFATVRTTSPRLMGRLMSLTLETVLLTHLVGAVMCVLFLTSPAKARTGRDEFWVLLEIVTELYALSMLFTINSRAAARRLMKGAPMPTPPPLSTGGPPTSAEFDEESKLEHGAGLGQTRLDRHVEGYQGSTPFGVRITDIAQLSSDHSTDSSLLPIRSRMNSDSSASVTPVVSPCTPHVYGGRFYTNDDSSKSREDLV